MTTPHRTLQMALDALDAITDDVDGTGLNTMPSFDKAIDAITALRAALAAPEPEPVALESVHLTRDTRGMCVVRVNGRVAIRDNGDIIDHMATLEWFAAPPAAPDSQWMPIETAPKDVTILLYGAKRLEMCVGMHHSRDGWVTDTTSEWMSMYPPTHWMPLPAAPAHLRDVAEKAAPAAPVPDGWVMVPMEPTITMCIAGDGARHNVDDATRTPAVYRAMIAASPAAPAAPVVPAVPLSCNKVPPGNGYCDHCARGEYEKCRYTTPAAPVVPLTDTETHAELWKLAVRKGLITVRSELIDPRNHGTRVSWMQGHDKACDISNDAAAHGIAASPEQPK